MLAEKNILSNVNFRMLLMAVWVLPHEYVLNFWWLSSRLCLISYHCDASGHCVSEIFLSTVKCATCTCSFLFLKSKAWVHGVCKKGYPSISMTTLLKLSYCIVLNSFLSPQMESRCRGGSAMCSLFVFVEKNEKMSSPEIQYFINRKILSKVRLGLVALDTLRRDLSLSNLVEDKSSDQPW